MPEKLFENVCDEAVFSRIYVKYSKELYSYLYYRFGETLSPNDKMQDAFIKLLYNCKKVSPDKARSYVYKVATNMVLNDLKHQKVVLKYKGQKTDEHCIESPEFLLEHDEFLKKYQIALSKLTEDQRVSFLMNKVEGKKHAEIAEILGVTRKAVENRIYTAYNKLKNDLEGFK